MEREGRRGRCDNMTKYTKNIVYISAAAFGYFGGIVIHFIIANNPLGAGAMGYGLSGVGGAIASIFYIVEFKKMMKRK